MWKQFAYLNIIQRLDTCGYYYGRLWFRGNGSLVEKELSAAEAAALGPDYAAGDPTCRFTTQTELAQVTQQRYREQSSDAKVLLIGNPSARQPMCILDHTCLPYGIQQALNHLHQTCKWLDWWGGGFDYECEQVAKVWCNLLAAQMD